MKPFKRIMSLALLLCMVISLLPPMQLTRAAEITQRYELDTDGIDPGATYLIVNTGTAGSGNALRFHYSSIWDRDFYNQTLQVQTDEEGVRYIAPGFANEADCQFQFSAENSGAITHGNYSVNLSDGNFSSGNADNTLTFTNVGNGAYRIHYTAWWNTYYLRYSNSSWSRSNSSSTVYLYKLTEHVVGYDVIYDGNGSNAGTLPENATMLSPGEEHTVRRPSEDLRIDAGEDTYLFQCWNTAADGSGTEYKPDEVITVTGDVTLYAQWYQQTKHTVSMITYLDGVPTDVDVISGQDKQFFAQLEGGDGTYIPLHRKADGTYSAKVAENGTYVIYAQVGDGAYEEVHGHKAIIYNQDGGTECVHYSVRFDAAGGSFSGEAPAEAHYHAGETVIAPEAVPTLAGNRFLGWQDDLGNVYAPGSLITASLDRTMVLTALWEKTISVTVNITLHHTSATGGANPEGNKHAVSMALLQYVNQSNLPVQELSFDKTSPSYRYDELTKTTTYTYTFTDLPLSHYHATAAKSHYDMQVTHSGEHDADQVIDIVMTYDPSSFDLDFQVAVDPRYEGLEPQSVNVKLLYWGEKDGVLGWHTIPQQEGTTGIPVSVPLVDGKGTGSYPVWQYWPESEGIPYVYRVEVTSFVLPDGTIVHASGDLDTYRPNDTGLYTATVTIGPDVEGGTGKQPTYPENTHTPYYGAYYNASSDEQNGMPVITVSVNPYTVTFDAGAGLVNGEETIILENQYRYPDLNSYTAVPNADDKLFICWTDAEGNPVENLSGQLLTENVTYYARYNENLNLFGMVHVDAGYLQDGKLALIPHTDRAVEVMVVLQKQVGDTFKAIDSQKVPIVYTIAEADVPEGTGAYEFLGLPNDGTQYRIEVLCLNYTSTYDNDQDDTFTAEEALVLVDEVAATGEVDIHLAIAPDCYPQTIWVDASQIQHDLRPTGALVQILYRDLGDVHNYQVISQHTVDPFGVPVTIHPSTGNSTPLGDEVTPSEDVWNWHTNGTLYEYQAQVYKLYGNNVEGAYMEEGSEYTDDSPFTIHYGPSNNYLNQISQEGVPLKVTLVPKQYPVILDLNLGDDPATPVHGLEDFHVDDGTGNERYVHMHTWSYADAFTAYPYREGYVFTGWTTTETNEVYIDNGTVHVGNTLSQPITLTAQWEKLTGTDYTVRHLELNTDKVLHGAQAISGAALGDVVVAADKALALDGYVYAGAWTSGQYVDRADNPTMTVSDDPTKNLMVIYYLPDGSDGYTEQVESNLEINKSAVLEDNGTYTITMDIHTKDNPITTLIQQNTPLDIVMVLDQSGSLAENNFEYLNALQGAVDSFVVSLADHGRHNEVDHRIAIVGYACNETDAHSSDPVKATGGKETDSWINTGVFDSNGEFHLYNVNGFNYTELADPSTMTADGIYYTKVTVDGEDVYLLLTHHDEYRHLIDEEQARVALLQGQTVFGYVYNEQNVGSFVELTRNSSGLWLYGDKKLYSDDRFFTYHTDVWTHRYGTEPRQIHAYGVGSAYTPFDGHEGVYTRQETTGDSFQQSIYQDALIPVSVGAAGSGGTNPGLLTATQSLGADGATRASYGMEMANEVLKATPVDPSEGRVRLVLMFTDGEPGYMGFDNSSGDEYYQQAVTEANNAIAQAYIAKNTYGAYVYTIGLYESAGVDSTSEAAYYMNALSSNYPSAQSMDDIKAAASYAVAKSGTALKNDGTFYVRSNNNYYELQYGYVRVSGSWTYRYCWYYKVGSTNYQVTTTSNPTVNNSGQVGSTTIYQRAGGYAETPYSGYYSTTESASHLKEYFENVLRDITTKITTEIILDPDTILRDIMNQGLVLTDGTVITVGLQEGTLDLQTDEILWEVDETGEPVLQDDLTVLELSSGETVKTNEENGVSILVYNLDAENPTDPNGEIPYHPHTVDITGYNFSQWYINETKPTGYKMIVTITRVEATDEVQWGRSTQTNENSSGLWLPADEFGQRELLLPFDQPTTIFVERAYVLDYGKEFDLSGWYFDDEDGKDATPIHVDCNIENGMNWFDPAAPNTANGKENPYGNTLFGNVKIENEQVSYQPTSMNWGNFDQFYVFGNTWRKTVLAQDANENGNLWNKVTVIPANNIYYEDSFITTEDATQNGIQGFTFTGAWQEIANSDAGQNTEVPEHIESSPYGDVHGWTDSLEDDLTFTDGSAHVTGLNKEMGASAEFTFTGTGVDVYTRTNASSGMVVAVLTQQNDTGSAPMVQSIAIDNLAMSGDYYHIPSVSFTMLPYGTYKLKLIATAAATATAEKRYEYYIDGVRIYNPLGRTTNYLDNVVKEAYGLETNAIFTEVRDILLDYGDFNTGLPDALGGKAGAVFIDWIQEGQGSEGDTTGTAVPTYTIGTFETYGPKNEVYLSAGQAVVLHVDESNTYYVGLKSLTGSPVTANVSGITQADPTAITLSHTTDLYYQVTPVDGYIVIQNGNTDGAILSITNLRTTSLKMPAENGGILPVKDTEAVALMGEFTTYLSQKPAEEVPPVMPEEQIPSAQEQAQANAAFANTLFTTVRQWLETN
ncbi:MAG: hypothetical protein E7437_08555 [Ruminococcaceae bacterium]|nr:hypothetical protein [Oscillospiraceae bacterium]